MEKIEIYQNEFTVLSNEDCQNIEGGSEFSEAVFRLFGVVARGFAAFAEGASSTVGQGYPPR